MRWGTECELFAECRRAPCPRKFAPMAPSPTELVPIPGIDCRNAAHATTGAISYQRVALRLRASQCVVAHGPDRQLSAASDTGDGDCNAPQTQRFGTEPLSLWLQDRCFNQDGAAYDEYLHLEINRTSGALATVPIVHNSIDRRTAPVSESLCAGNFIAFRGVRECQSARGPWLCRERPGARRHHDREGSSIPANAAHRVARRFR